MNYFVIIIGFFCLILFSQPAFAIRGVDFIDLLSYGGYDQVGNVKIADTTSTSSGSGSGTSSGTSTTTSSTSGSLGGADAGATLLLALSNNLLSPVIGAGIHYLTVNGTLPDSEVTDTNSTDSKKSSTETISVTSTKDKISMTSTSWTAHAGFRLGVPLVRIFLFGNGGSSSSDEFCMEKFNHDTGDSISNEKSTLTSHFFYGGTAAILVSFAPFINIGASGIYNVHSAKIANTIESNENSSQTQKITFNEMAANFVIDINF